MKRSISATVTMAAAAVFMAANVASANTECTIGNWSSSVGMATNGTGFSVGAPSATNRRFAGPCGLRVNVDGTARYLVDNSPSAESSYNARFYFFRNSLSSDVTIFRALDGSNSVIDLEFVQSSNAIRMKLDGTVVDTSAALASGWNAVQVSWNVQASPATARLTVNGTPGTAVTPANTTRRISSVQLGSIATGASPSGSIDFDDFDSRRASAPGGICRGLTRASDSQLRIADVQNIFQEIATGGGVLADGQPDFNGDGRVTLADVQEVFQRIATGAVSCSVNSL